MRKIKIFISSVQLEFAEERAALYDYLQHDPLLGKFFEAFIFERLPASDQKVAAVYLREVEYSDVYLCLLGAQYGSEDAEGISPTEREFDCATKLNKTRLVFLSNHSVTERNGKQNDFINKAASSMHMTNHELTNYLWNTYHPSQIWVVFSGIGVCTAILLLLYDKLILKSKAK